MTHDTPTPLVGFDGIPFHVRTEREVYPDWEWPPVTPVKHIPGSNSAVIQDMGTLPATISLLLEFDDVDDYYAFRRKLRATGTLTLLARYTSAVGTVRHVLGVDYEDLDQVRLHDIQNGLIAVGREWAQCTATFLRSMDPLTGEAS